MRIMAVSHPCVTDVNQQFYAELEALGHEVQLVVPANFRTEYSQGPVKVVRWPAFGGHIDERRVGLPASIPLHFYTSNLRPALEKLQPDVLFVEEEPYAVSAWQAFYASRHLPVKRVIYSAQNIVKRYPYPFRSMEQYVLSKADMAAVVSDQVGAVMRQKGFAGQLLGFPLGVDTKQFRPLPEERVRLRTSLGIPSACFVAGFVGRLVEEKGVSTLLEALPRLEQQQVKLLLVGSGPMLEAVRQAAVRHPGTVYIADHVKHNEVQLWMNAMDALVLPSLTMPNWKEQFGRVIVEAMACGIPVIGSDSGEIPVLIRHTGGGWLFPEGQAEALAAIIRGIRSNEADRRAKAECGYAKVQAEFSKRALARSFEMQLYRLIAQTRPDQAGAGTYRSGEVQG
ncbi:glycosyltransferase [Paenibacillus sp. y28]|uniref:glycosyltransferase n=1 Tax=Paenibacillus sp. y28 TaxID=3129110 RepID=UPI0030180274